MLSVVMSQYSLRFDLRSVSRFMVGDWWPRMGCLGYCWVGISVCLLGFDDENL